MERINVKLAERSYNILIGAELFDDSAHFSSISSGKQVVVISNDTVAPLYAERVMNTISSLGCQVSLLELPDGEQYKTLDTFNLIMSYLLEKNYGRDVVIVALGGGVVGDVVGFAASCYQRGVDFIQVPTTLLSQVDSSVGGKTAVNHPLGKNMIGAFYQPKSVVIDINCLSTLPAREFSAGMAEVIKYGIIADADFFDWLDGNMNALFALNPKALTYAISRCCQLKADVVAQDEKESGVRAMLNLGHTYGHAIEAEMGYGNWLHGEAVSVGMHMAALTAQKQGLLSEQDVKKIQAILIKAKLPILAPSSMSIDDFMKHMMRDKKVLAGQLRLILPTSIGSADMISDTPMSVINDVIESCKALD